MVKTGRNAPCPCGSGKKFKKCHGDHVFSQRQRNTDIAMVMRDLVTRKAQQDRADQSRIAKHGKGKPIIATDFGDWKLVAVGSEIHFGKAESAKYFSDFLSVYCGKCFGQQWIEDERAKKFDRQHPAVQWLTKFIDTFPRLPKDSTGGVDPVGSMLSWLRLGYDLYQIEHNSLLQENIVARLRHKEQFQGARFELLCTATMISAGYEIEFEDESDSTSKHPEFVAVDTRTGLRIAIEAKSKHRSGVLGFQSENVPNSSSEKIGVRSLIGKALKKNPDIPYIVFVDLNLNMEAPDIRNLPAKAELDEIIDNLQANYGHRDFPANDVFFVNDLSYRHLESVAPTPSLWAYIRHCEQARQPFSSKKVSIEIAEALYRRTEIPLRFPEN